MQFNQLKYLNYLKYQAAGLALLSLMACSPVKSVITNEYRLALYSNKQLAKKTRHVTLLVTAPESVAGYDTEAMLYTTALFKLDSFANNAWSSAPAAMLYPLLTQSLQSSGYFYAVTSSPYSESADFRLDTQLLQLQQNFLKKPSEIDLAIKIVLTDVRGNKIIASRIIMQHLPCPADTPYGGVLAANKGVEKFTALATDFVLKEIKRS